MEKGIITGWIGSDEEVMFVPFTYRVEITPVCGFYSSAMFS